MTISMKASDQVLPARYYALLLELVRSQGVSLDALLDQLGIDVGRLSEPDATLSLDQVDALIEAAVSATGREDLGFHIGRLIKSSNHELLGYALMTSATLDEALRLAARYWPLITPIFALRYDPLSRSVRIHLQPTFALKPLTWRFHIEAITSAFHAEIRFLLSTRVPAYLIQLPVSLLDAAPRYQQLAPARIKFDLEDSFGLIIEMSNTMLSRPLAFADSNALKLARKRCDNALARLTRHGSLSDWIRRMLDQASDHQPRQHEIARLLHLSTRTLNRRLADEGTRFRELGLSSRHQRACRLLAQSELSITRIGLQLGFKESANFTRAFRSIEGMPPAEYRKRLKV